MNSAEGFIVTAGALSFAGNWKEVGSFPSNGVKIIGATVGLVIIASLASNTALAEPVKWLAILMLLGAALRYIPGLARKKD